MTLQKAKPCGRNTDLVLDVTHAVPPGAGVCGTFKDNTNSYSTYTSPMGSLCHCLCHKLGRGAYIMYDHSTR